MNEELINIENLLSSKSTVISLIVPVPWEANLDEVSQYINILDSEERQQLNKFKVKKKKIEFLLGRILLKGIIGRLLKIKARDIVFSKGKYGKLYLCDTCEFYQDIFFNLSHSDGMLVCGISRCGELGIDVESTEREFFQIMEVFFLPTEIDYVNAQVKNEKNDAFYKIWTRKEAFMKLTGKGFSLSPFEFTVPLELGEKNNTRVEFDSYTPSDRHIMSIAVQKLNKNEKITFVYINMDLSNLIDLIKE
ncbi:4'-phosphopantetheinyl transferase family protein [Peribacillus frigoritolerans]|uniref:4'-phosphopantetheinyl transferase family protein n=1 Tax=Peribacillus frigoritolerans TaxID=450367 RepID=UPI002EBDE1BB|nr:4'-phosphopantetheinyl transferase superfamily protein [Peribacillus frigoritolerans]